MKQLFCILASLVLFPLSAAGQADADKTVVPQVLEYSGPDREIIEAQQVERPGLPDDGAVEQLAPASADVQVWQVEEGADLCDVNAAEHEFCADMKTANRTDGKASKRTSPEEVVAIGAPPGIDQFTRDPARTADEIARGELSSLAAQSLGGSLLGLQKPPPTKEETNPESPDLSDLPPEVLQNQ